jgi:RTX calcium-binding nonapeptide repeat (4 copies)
MRGAGRLIWVAVVAALAAAFGLAFARHGAEPRFKPVAFASGILSTSSSGEGAAILSVGNLAPGRSGRGQVTLRNQSSGEGRVVLTQRLRSESPGMGGGRLFDDLRLTIRQLGGGSDSLVYSGPMAAMGPTALRRFRGHETRTYAFEVRMPDTGAPGGPASGDNAYQGGTVSVDYVWSATSLGRTGSRRCRHGVLGTLGADVLKARSRGERVLARSGDDRVTGSRAADCIFGGRGDDLVRGRLGADWLRGGRGLDVLRGGGGNDRLRTSDGAPDRLHCGAGWDTAIIDALDRVAGCERVRVR